MKYKIFIGIGIACVLLFFVLAAISSLIARNQPTSGLVVIDPKELAKREAADAKQGFDQNGSLPITTEPPVKIEPFVVTEPDPVEPTPTVDLIKQAFAEKYSKPLSDINVTITQETATHAKGGVSFGAGGPGEGGLFLATLIDNKWVLVFDGNGSIACQDLAPYNFPAEMIAEICYN